MTRAAALSALACMSDVAWPSCVPATRVEAPRRGSTHYALRVRGGEAVTAAELQDVLNLRGSDTACLLAVGAEWCGPCKALKPLLKTAADASQGTLLVKEIDADSEAAVAQALRATQLPTVYSLRDGKLIEMMVGLPKSIQDLAAFVMRAMGDADEAKVPAGHTKDLARVVGRASLGPAGREDIEERVKEALRGAKDLDRAVAREALKTLTQYLKGDAAYQGIPIFLDNELFAAKIAPVEPALDILKAAGYVEIPGDPEAEEGSDGRRDQLMPTHRNLAVFELCAGTIDHALNRDL